MILKLFWYRVLLIEFKRLGRKQYKDSEHPQTQLQKYIRELQSFESIDINGRPINLNTDAMFYCYVVADIFGKMNEWTYT